MVVGKFVVYEISPYSDHPEAPREIVLRAVMPGDTEDIDEDERFHRYTPNGQIEMTVDNLKAAEQFKIGEAMYVHFDTAGVTA